MLKKEEMRKWITLIIIAVFSYWFATNIDLILNILTKLVIPSNKYTTNSN